ncbi:hypothetical protein EUX98_g5174 [Antrodiella citrinella]|uniref:DUF6532 domain-containing protein n=1 Tax=Antrodiella citrinella TaxID=2447956 RepID=A0A4S4MUN5_9APHY|nr:hypothetical protein EUX98_g5174 [Antrodiella citrinella]
MTTESGRHSSSAGHAFDTPDKPQWRSATDNDQVTSDGRGNSFTHTENVVIQKRRRPDDGGAHGIKLQRTSEASEHRFSSPSSIKTFARLSVCDFGYPLEPLSPASSLQYIPLTDIYGRIVGGQESSLVDNGRFSEMGQQKEDCVSPNDEEEREADSGQQDYSEEGVESDDVDSDATSISSSELVSTSGRSSEFRCHSADYQLDQMPDGHGDEASGDERFGWNAYDKQAASLSGAYNQGYSRSVFRDSLAMRSAQLPRYPVTSLSQVTKEGCKDSASENLPMVKYEQPYKVAGLAQQSAPIQDVIRAAIKVILKDLLINGQRVTTEKQAQHQRSLILGCIEEIRKQNKKPGDDAVYKEIHVRVSKDTGYAKTAIVLCKRRCKNMRCDIKQACAGLIAREYGLAGLTARNIKKNLMTDLKYIYSGSPKARHKPFERPIFSSAIKRIISNNRYGGIKYCSDFPVSPQGDKEIPAPFLAYIAGGITASLKAYIRNGRKIHSTLETVIFEDEYYKALKFIEEIREEKPTEYTDMMTQLFNDAS